MRVDEGSSGMVLFSDEPEDNTFPDDFFRAPSFSSRPPDEAWLIEDTLQVEESPPPDTEGLSCNALVFHHEEVIAPQTTLDFGEICRKYYQPLYSFIRLYIRADWYLSAEDIVQDTMETAIKHWDKVKTRDESAVRAWLYRVAKSRCCDHYRYEQRHFRHWSGSQQRHISPMEEPSPSQHSEIIEELVEHLPLRMRECIKLVWQQGHSAEEAAIILRISPGTVRGYLSRARDRITEMYQLNQEQSRTNGRGPL